MSKIRLGGMKVLEGRSHLKTSWDRQESALAAVCHRMAADRINISYLTYLDDEGRGCAGTALCPGDGDGFSSYFLLKLDNTNAVRLQSQLNVLSVFPHDQKPEVPGALLGLFAAGRVKPYGIASSPSAMSVLVPSADTRKIIDALFDLFHFPTYRSPLEWHAAYQGKESVLKEVICSYEEKVIKVYNVVCQQDLDLWTIAVDFRQMAELGAAFMEMQAAGMKMPFFLAQPGRDEELAVSFCTASCAGEELGDILDRHLPAGPMTRTGPKVAVFVHGPHFGDRCGITAALTGALFDAKVRLPALNCAVSSISMVLRATDVDRALEALATRFEIPERRAISSVSASTKQ